MTPDQKDASGRVPYASLHKRLTKGQSPLTLRDYEDPRMWAPLRNAPFTAKMVASRKRVVSNIPSICRSTKWCHVQSAASRGAFLVHGLVVYIVGPARSGCPGSLCVSYHPPFLSTACLRHRNVRATWPCFRILIKPSLPIGNGPLWEHPFMLWDGVLFTGCVRDIK